VNVYFVLYLSVYCSVTVIIIITVSVEAAACVYLNHTFVDMLIINNCAVCSFNSVGKL